MHLQRSHNLTTAEYEAKYGEVEPGSNNVVSSVNGEESSNGFGQHFLITDQGGNLLQQSPASVVSSSNTNHSTCKLPF